MRISIPTAIFSVCVGLVGCGVNPTSDGVSGTSDGQDSKVSSADRVAARKPPECAFSSIGENFIAKGAPGASSPESAAASYVKKGQEVDVFDQSSDSATVFVTDHGKAVYELEVTNFGNGWISTMQKRCA